MPPLPRNSKTIFPKYLWVSAVVILLGLICLVVFLDQRETGDRNLETPARRLVGHWLLYSQSELPSSHLFFGPLLPSDDNQGTISMIDLDGMVFRGKYRLVQQYPRGLDMKIIQDLGPSLKRTALITIEREGRSGRYRYNQFEVEIDVRLEYVDDTTVPPANFIEALKTSKD